MKNVFQCIFCILLIILSINVKADINQRERILFDESWKFAYGYPSDAVKDFSHGTAYFSFFAKAGYGDGPAAVNFDDRAWRALDLPHDWAVEQPFDAKGSHSHGYKAIGRNFPDVSVGWYRKEFFIPESDLGKRISITFEGVHRDSKVWINGHYLGNETSGYYTFTYDISQYLNYNGKNVISVRADVTFEEGWYYEGAGIYRHVWMNKTSPLHIASDGTFIYTELDENNAIVNIEATIVNESVDNADFIVRHKLLNADNVVISQTDSYVSNLKNGDQITDIQKLKVGNPHLWSIEDPYLHKVVTTIEKNNITIDTYETVIGLRTIRFDANEGFFLNGKHVKLKGTNNHQDHAGVGTAMPDELINYRVSQLKKMGSNAIRSSHNPASPALLDACDRIGMLIIDEHRLMGTAPFIKNQIERLIKRDRNHPSVILWSMGNEEWAIEGNITGERIIQEMQSFAKKFDHTRPINCASSGGWGKGVSKHIEVMGFNYLFQGNTDEYHKNFPNTPSLGTEEGSTNTTRGIYFDDPVKQHIAAYDRRTFNGLFCPIEDCWKYYDSRPYLAGMFIWTGFDYRGEPTPYGWPSINSYFGMYDVCGFPKDNVWYLKSWWGNEPVLHILPHWNWKGKEGEKIKVVTYSNCDQVELFLNNKSLGKKTMEKNSHLEWEVAYKPGTLKAIGYKNGKKSLSEIIETTDKPASLAMESHKQIITADGRDLSVITVSAKDIRGREVPDADNLVSFEIKGPGKIIGVGNGDPTCLENDKYIESVKPLIFENMTMKSGDNLNLKDILAGKDETGWIKAFSQKRIKAEAIVYRAKFDLPEDFDKGKVMLYLRTIGNKQDVYLNGNLLGKDMEQNTDRYNFEPELSMLKSGTNILTYVTTPYYLEYMWSEPNTDPGVAQLIMPQPQWKRSLFSGKAMIIVQSTKEKGNIVLKAKADGLNEADINIETH